MFNGQQFGYGRGGGFGGGRGGFGFGRGRGGFGNAGSLRQGWGVCFNCGRPGHPAALCNVGRVGMVGGGGYGPVVPVQNNAPPAVVVPQRVTQAIVCGHCGGGGHGRTNCPSAPGHGRKRLACCVGGRAPRRDENPVAVPVPTYSMPLASVSGQVETLRKVFRKAFTLAAVAVGDPARIHRRRITTNGGNFPGIDVFRTSWVSVRLVRFWVELEAEGKFESGRVLVGDMSDNGTGGPLTVDNFAELPTEDMLKMVPGQSSGQYSVNFREGYRTDFSSAAPWPMIVMKTTANTSFECVVKVELEGIGRKKVE